MKLHCVRPSGRWTHWFQLAETCRFDFACLLRRERRFTSGTDVLCWMHSINKTLWWGSSESATSQLKTVLIAGEWNFCKKGKVSKSRNWKVSQKIQASFMRAEDMTHFWQANSHKDKQLLWVFFLLQFGFENANIFFFFCFFASGKRQACAFVTLCNGFK